MMRYVIFIKKEKAVSVFNTDTKTHQQDLDVLKKISLEGISEGLYILTIKNDGGCKMRGIRVQDNRIIDSKDYFEVLSILKTDIVICTNKKEWVCFSIKRDEKVKRFYDLGDNSLAYEKIEFECTVEEYNKYRLNLLSYKDGIAIAYRYKFTFYYMMNSNRNVPETDIRNYTKDMLVYRKYNPQCEITLDTRNGRLKDGVFI